MLLFLCGGHPIRATAYNILNYGGLNNPTLAIKIAINLATSWDNAGRGARTESIIRVVLPSLGIDRKNNVTQLTWPDWATNFTLWSTTNLNQPFGNPCQFFRLEAP